MATRADEAVGRHLSFLQPPERRDESTGCRAGPRGAGGRARRNQGPAEGRQPDRRVGEVLADLRRRPRTVGVSAISRDITPLVRGALEVAEREERIRLLLDSTAEAIYGIDLNGICTFCNAACTRLLGYDSPAALIGKQMHPLDTSHRSRRHAVSRRAIVDLRRHAPPPGGARRRRGAWRADGTVSPPSPGAIRSAARAR